MNITDVIAKAGGLGSIARELGVDEATAERGASALLPAILGGFKGQAKASPEGLGGLAGLLEGLGGAGLADNVIQPGPTDTTAGNGVLGKIFGSKDVSRAVADDAAAKSGLSADLLKKMLPMLAMLVAGHMSKRAGAGQGGGVGGILGSILGGAMGGGAGGGQPGQASPGGLGGLGAMLDFDGDGNPLDDILGMAGKLTGR